MSMEPKLNFDNPFIQAKIRAGEADIVAGRVSSHEEVMRCGDWIVAEAQRKQMSDVRHSQKPHEK